MNFFVSILGLALLYTANSLPILEQSTSSAATTSTDPKTDAKPELSSTTLAAENITESASKETSSPAPSSTSATEERASTPKVESLPQQPQPLKPLAPSLAIPVPEPAKGHHHAEAPKPAIDIKSSPLTAALAAKPDIKAEQVSSSEQPKELNNQVNAVSVDEPKPVQNEVKSEIPKLEQPKEEVKPEKLEEKKEEKREDHKPVPVLPILGGHEAKPAEKAEETKKPMTSSEEKLDSHEKDVSKEGDKKEPAKPDQSSESSEEKKPEGIKKEESSVRPPAEALPTEASKPSSSPQPALEKLPEKSDSEKDVIKREASKDKQGEKKPIDKKPVKDVSNKKPE